jgi:hypothetical protein
MLKMVFHQKPKKLWPGFNIEALQRRLNQITKNLPPMTLTQVVSTDFTSSNVTSKPFTGIYGRVRGTILSIQFTEAAFRDNLIESTRIGNALNLIRFASNIFFFSMLIIFSGGATPNTNTYIILQIFGVWTIFDLAFNRGILALYRYQKISSTFGIGGRTVVLGIFISMWREVIFLIVLVNLWSLFKYQNLATPKTYFQISSTLLLLLIIGFPLSYLVSYLSKTHIDARFLSPIVFRFLILTTPIFNSFHNHFPFISTLLSYSPLNLCFSTYFPNLGPDSLSISTYLLFLGIELLVFASIKEKIKPYLWKFEKC